MPPLRRCVGVRLRWPSCAATSPAAAQDACTQSAPGEFKCENNGDTATTTQTLTGSGVTIAIEDGFDIDTSVSGGNALVVRSRGGIDIQQTSGSSTLTGDVCLVVDQSGAGDMTVQTGGAVTGTNGYSVYACNGYNGASSAGLIAIDTSGGSVSGSQGGISVFHYGSGTLRIETADVTTEGANGVYAFGSTSGAGVTIDTIAGTISGGTSGIRAANLADSQLSITTGDVSGGSASGIFADSRGATSINTTGGTVARGTTGITATNTGAGSLNITTAGVTGGANDSIAATNAFSGTSLSVDS